MSRRQQTLAELARQVARGLVIASALRDTLAKAQAVPHPMLTDRDLQQIISKLEWLGHLVVWSDSSTEMVYFYEPKRRHGEVAAIEEQTARLRAVITEAKGMLPWLRSRTVEAGIERARDLEIPVPIFFQY